MTTAAAYLIIYKLIAMMIVIGCPLAMVSGSGARPKKKRAGAGRNRRATVKASGTTKTRRPKVKRTKRTKTKKITYTPDQQALLDRAYHGRIFKTAA